MRILFLFPYPSGTAASQRFRFEQYLGFLEEAGIHYRLEPFLDTATWRILYQPGHTGRKARGIAKGFLRRTILLFAVPRYDIVFIHREATPLGPPVFEWIIAKILRKRIVFDFDDAIWLPNTSEHNRLAARLKWHHKTASICRWAWKISAGNKYLLEFGMRSAECGNKKEARNENREVSKGRFEQKLPKTLQVNSEFRIPNSEFVFLPTTIDTENLHNRLKEQDTPEFVIGWTGTHSTIAYLEPLVPILEKLAETHAFTFLVISDRKPDFDLPFLRYLPWQKATETDDLLGMNVGVMPLTDDPWSRGKCGFKALQYMALGIPAVASPVGVNSEIIEPGVNGFLCAAPDEWLACLTQLLKNPTLRTEMGRQARCTVEERYSVQANRRTFLGLFLTA